MKNIVISVLYIIAFVIRHRSIPDSELTSFVVSQQVLEPWRNLLGNAWAWAEYLPSPVEENKPAVIRHDGDGGAHALNIYYNLVDFAEWGWWDEPIDRLVLKKAEMFRFTPEQEAAEEAEEAGIPEWATMPVYDLDDECWF